MKIAIISSYPSQGCGISKYTEELIAALRESGIEVHSYRIFFYRERLKNVLWLRFMYEVFNTDPDLVHIQYTPTICGPLMPLFFMLLRVLRFKTSIVVTAHEKPSVYLRYFDRVAARMFALYEKFIYRNSDSILVHTIEHQHELVDKYGLAMGKIKVIPHAVGKSRKVTARQMQNITTKYCLKDGKIITFFGIIRPNKGIEYLIQSFAKLVVKRSNLILLIAGAPRPAHSKYFRELEDLVGKLKIQDKAKFVGFVEEKDVPVLMRLSNIIVLPYTDVTQSGVLYQQVIPYTKPVIVTNVGDLAKTVAQHNIGVVVPAQDVDSLYQAILGMIQATPRLLRLYERNQTKLKHELAWANVARMYVEAYRDALRQQKEI